MTARLVDGRFMLLPVHLERIAGVVMMIALIWAVADFVRRTAPDADRKTR